MQRMVQLSGSMWLFVATEIIVYGIWSMPYSSVYNANTKFVLLRLTRSRSPKWYSVSSVICACIIGVALVPVPRSGYCWGGVVLVPCIGVCRRLCMESSGGRLASVT